jgi:hypothetical protein
MKVGGAAVVLVSSFLTWLEIRLKQGDTVRHGTANGYDFTFTGAIPVVLAVVVGAVTVLLAVGRIPRHQRPWPLALLIGAALAAGLLLVRLVLNPYDPRADLEALGGSVSRSLGMVLAAAGGLVVLVGAVLSFREARHSHVIDTVDSSHLEWAPEPQAFQPQAFEPPAFPPPAPPSPASSSPTS